MRHVRLVSSAKPATAATLLTKAQALDNAQSAVIVVREALLTMQVAVDLFTKTGTTD